MTRYLLGAVVRLWRRMFKGGIDRWERGRLRSIAAAGAPLHGEALPAADQELADAHHEIVTEWRTTELPVLAPVRRRTVTRRPARWQQVAARRRLAAQHRAADPLTGPLTGPLAAPVVLSSMRSSEPPAWHLESFTESWTTAEFAALAERAKAGAR